VPGGQAGVPQRLSSRPGWPPAASSPALTLFPSPCEAVGGGLALNHYDVVAAYAAFAQLENSSLHAVRLEIRLAVNNITCKEVMIT